jgi:hypothetical protein
MQDFAGPVGFRLATRHPEKISFLIVQNANAYEEGLPDDFWAPAKASWKDPSPENFGMIGDAAMSNEALEWNYTHGVQDVAKISPDSWVLQQALINRSGNKESMLDLLYDYRTNLALYPRLHAYFRRHQPLRSLMSGRLIAPQRMAVSVVACPGFEAIPRLFQAAMVRVRTAAFGGLLRRRDVARTAVQSVALYAIS